MICCTIFRFAFNESHVSKFLLLDGSRSQEHFLPLTYNLASGIFRGNERGHGKGIVEFGRGSSVTLITLIT